MARAGQGAVVRERRRGWQAGGSPGLVPGCAGGRRMQGKRGLSEMKKMPLPTLLGLLASVPAFAQVPTLPPATEPGAVQQRQIEEERRRRDEEREQRKTDVHPLKTPAEAAPAVQPGQEAVRFFVRQILFTKSEILGAAELDALAKDYLNRNRRWPISKPWSRASTRSTAARASSPPRP